MRTKNCKIRIKSKKALEHRMAVFSLLSENLGKGITIKNNRLDLNTNTDFVWTGQNFFTKNVIFATDQIFPIQNLSHDNTALGPTLISNGKNWQVLPPGFTGQTLTVTSKGLNWANIDLKDTEGVLPISKGGTGWGKYPYNGILFSSDKEFLDLLPIPSGRKVLFSENSSIHWEDFSKLAEEILVKMPKHFEVNKNKFIFSNENPVMQIKDVLPAGMHLSKNKSLLLSVNHSDFQDFIEAFPTTSLVLNNENKNNLFEIISNINDNHYNSIFSIDSTGLIVKGKITVDNLCGVLGVLGGGTGIDSYEEGDLIYAKNNKELAKLSTSNFEGCILKVVNGKPAYVPHDKTDFDGEFQIPVRLSQPKNNLASLIFPPADLLQNPKIGYLEFDGNKLFLTNDVERKTISFTDSNISGFSENVRGVVDLKNGGTGKDLTSLPAGQIIYKSNDGLLSGLDSGEPGSVLMSTGDGSQPLWKYILDDICTDNFSGIDLEKTNTSVNIKLDTSSNFNPEWNGVHEFQNDIKIKNSQIQFFINENIEKAPLRISKSKAPRKADEGEIWFDGKDLFINSSGKNINITKVDDISSPAFDYVPSHYLTLCAGSEVVDNRKIRMKVPVPFLVAKGSLVQAKWRLRRLEITIDEPPTVESASFKIYANNKIILNNGFVPEGHDHIVIDSFDEPYIETSEMLQVECTKTGGSNFWSIFLLIDLN